MKILALIGSPRKGSNTDILVDHILEGAKENHHTNEKIYLYDYKILPCMDCRYCKQGDYICALKDDMQKIYPKLEEADLIIFGTPLYWYGPTGKMKLLIDRMRPFIANGKLKGRKVIVVTPSEEGAGACKPLVEMFQKCFSYIGLQYINQILAKAYEYGEIERNSAELKKAYQIGASLEE